MTDVRVYAQRAEVFTGIGDAYSLQVMKDKPLVYWRLGERSGATAYDFSGWGRDITTYNSPTRNVANINPHAVTTCTSWNGTTQFATIDDAAWMDTSAFTVDAWFKATELTASRMILTRDDAGSNRMFRLKAKTLYPTAGAQIEFNVYTSGGSFTVLGDTTLQTNGVYHIAATFGGTSAKVYLNGLVDGSGTTSGTLPAIAQYMLMGALTGGGEYHIGQLQDVAFYGTELSGARIQAHYLAGGEFRAYRAATTGIRRNRAVQTRSRS